VKGAWIVDRVKERKVIEHGLITEPNLIQVMIQGPVAWFGSHSTASSWTRVLGLIAQASRQSTSKVGIGKDCVRKEGDSSKAEFDPGRHNFFCQLPKRTLAMKRVTILFIKSDCI
jgi:hypothetical protein